MKSYGNKYFFKKKVLLESKKNSENLSTSYLKFVHKILNAIDLSILVLIFVLFFISLDSQAKWSETYKSLSKTRAKNSNLIDYISRTEEFYITELDSLESFKKTTPRDLIYIDKIDEKKDNFFYKKIKNIFNGLSDSRFQRGY